MITCDHHMTALPNMHPHALLQILELLWGLAHLPQLSREMVDLALEAHSSILIDSYHTKEAEKRTYISKCVEDIRKVGVHTAAQRDPPSVTFLPG